MVSTKQAKTFCCEDISLIENYEEAVKSKERYDVHHKLGLWFKRQWLIDNGFYYDQRAEMLVFMKCTEHTKLHQIGNQYNKGKTPWNKGKNGIYSEETRTKMGDSQRGAKCCRARKIMQIDANSGDLIKIWDYMRLIERELGFCWQSISNCCRGVRKTAYGFIWKYAD